VSTITDMREQLMKTLAELRDRDHPMDIDRARAVAHVASVLVESAKVEVEYIKATGADTDSLFISPLNSDPGRLLNGEESAATRPTPTGLIHRMK
jgi:hypothetical protein